MNCEGNSKVRGVQADKEKRGLKQIQKGLPSPSMYG